MKDYLNFPVIALGKSGAIELIFSEEQLITCSRSGFKNGAFNNLILLDSNRYKYEIKQAKKIGTVGSFWGLSLKYGQLLRVKLEFNSFRIKLTISEIKLEIINTFKRDEDFWISGDDFEEIIKNISNSKSIGELIQQLKEILYKEY